MERSSSKLTTAPFIPPFLQSSHLLYTTTDIYDKDKVDIEHVSMDDVFKLLQCDEHGITDEEAVRRVGIFGPNKVRFASAFGSIFDHLH
jgi:hypothetical protein